jgi:tripartite motif-containing protein 71
VIGNLSISHLDACTINVIFNLFFIVNKQMVFRSLVDYHFDLFQYSISAFSLMALGLGVVFFLLANINIFSDVSAYENATTEYKFVKKWGSKGNGTGQFQRPHDLDFSNDEKILYAVDRDGNRIQAFDKNGTFLFSWGELGKGDGQFHVPYGIDVDANGNVWVADRANSRVEKFDSNGNFITKWGSYGKENGEFHNPRHVAVSKDLRYVYVADSSNNRIQKYDINGSFVQSIGKLGNKSGEFNLPTTIEIDSKGNFIVNERGNERIQKFDANWNPILMWGSKGSGDYQFCHMEHIAIDKYDNIYVTDPQSDPGCSNQPRVLKFNSEGKFITKWGSYGKGDGQFIDPEHLAVDSEGNVYVSDRKKEIIQVFVPVVVK